MKDCILQEDTRKIQQVEVDFFKANTHLMKKDFSLANKIFYLYDAPELDIISNKAIVANDLIFVQSKFFQSIRESNFIRYSDADYLQSELLISLAKGTFPDAVKISQKDLLKTLNDNGYTKSLKEIQDLVSTGEKSKSAELKYINLFTNKKLPVVVHEYNKSKDIDKVVEFLTDERKNFTSLRYAGYGFLMNELSRDKIKSKFGFDFGNVFDAAHKIYNNETKIAMALLVPEPKIKTNEDKLIEPIYEMMEIREKEEFERSMLPKIPVTYKFGKSDFIATRIIIGEFSGFNDISINKSYKSINSQKEDSSVVNQSKPKF